ncbi:MAG: hypothetical protein ABUS47_04715 [Steroidobacter sp.]
MGKTQNPYLPPVSQLGSGIQANSAETGVNVGIIFMLPLILFPVAGALIMLSNGVTNRLPYLISLFMPAVEGVCFGWWCGRGANRRSCSGMFIVSIVQGTCILITFLASVQLFMWLSGRDIGKFSTKDARPILIAWVICVAWSFFTIVTIRWRFHKLTLAENSHVTSA